MSEGIQTTWQLGANEVVVAGSGLTITPSF